jgi:beta-phosphoglucomutase-like phosphatase (HAD superfamily)
MDYIAQITAEKMIFTPDSGRGLIFDVDGVLANTEEMHYLTWNQAIASLNQERDRRIAEITRNQYRCISGRKRKEVVHAILGLNAIDDPGLEQKLSDIKNQAYRTEILLGNVASYKDGVQLLLWAYSTGCKTVYASSSANATLTLENIRPYEEFSMQFPFLTPETTLMDLFPYGGIDGNTKVRSKPEPDVFLMAAQMIQVDPSRSIVMEDAISGVKGAKRGNFYCIGLSRDNDPGVLLSAGADVAYRILPDACYNHAKDKEYFNPEIEVRKLCSYTL